MGRYKTDQLYDFKIFMLEKSHKDKYNKRKINAKPLRFKHLIIKKQNKERKEKNFQFSDRYRDSDLAS